MYRHVAVAVLLAGAIVLAGSLPARGADTAAPVKLSGKGDQATAKFRLKAGFSSWHITHEGRSNFQVKLLSTDGKIADMNINEIGRFQGTQAFPIKKDGDYLINVHADGKWSITIEQPRPTEAHGKPLEFAGKGPNISRFVMLPKGISVFTISHKGDSSFRVKILDRDGKYVEQVVGVIGAYNGSKAITMEEDGMYLLNISGTGEWKVKVE